MKAGRNPVLLIRGHRPQLEREFHSRNKAANQPNGTNDSEMDHTLRIAEQYLLDHVFMSLPRSFVHPQSFQDHLVLPDVIVTGGPARPHWQLTWPDLYSSTEM